MERFKSAAAAATAAATKENDEAFGPGSAVRPRFARPTLFVDHEITRTRLMADLRPPTLFDPSSLIPDDDTEEEIVTAVVRAPQVAANDAAALTSDVVDVIALEDAIPRPALPKIVCPPPPLRAAVMAPQDKTLLLGSPRPRRPSSLKMDDETRAALRAKLEEVAAQVRRREIDFGEPVPPPAGFDRSWPAPETFDREPVVDESGVVERVSVQELMRPSPPSAFPGAAPLKRPRSKASSASQQSMNAAIAGVFVLLLAGTLISLSAMRPKTYGSTCTLLWLR